MALHFNCPFCGHSEHYDQAPVGGFTACPSCNEELPASYGAGESESPPAAEPGETPAEETPDEDDAEFLHKPPTPDVMPTIAGATPPEHLMDLRAPRRKSYLWLWILLIVLFLGALFLFLLMLPAVNAAREAARRNACLNRVQQLSLALTMYEHEHGSLPPAYIADENGKPMHSWRVLLLPYMEMQGLYDQYNFSEPWDSENNLKVAQAAPDLFACPTDPHGAAEGHTNYMVIVGPETAFPGDSRSSFRDLRDDPHSTILLAEVADSGALWTQPVDLSADDIVWKLNGDPSNSISSHHAGNGAFVAMGDGTVRFLRGNISAADIEAMSTIAGGEQVELDGGY